MNGSDTRPELPDLSHSEENRGKLPLDELARHWDKQVAFSPDGTRIVPSGETEEELEAVLQAAGIYFSQVVFSYIDGSDVSRI